MTRFSGIVDLRFILQLQVKKERNDAVHKNLRELELPSMNNPQLKLVSFDLDGTILRGQILNYAKIPEALHRKISEHDALFFDGERGYEETLTAQFALFAGMKIEEIAPDLDGLPLIGDLDKALQGLDRAGVKCLILTDNPSFAAKPLRKLGFHDIIGSEAETSNGTLTGRMDS
jgi:phosphoserine phosphatase